MKNEVVEILVRRDGCTRKEAEARVRECRQTIRECLAVGDYTGAEDAIPDILGLEIDYIYSIL